MRVSFVTVLTDLLPEPLSPRQALPRPQNPVLRRRAISLLRDDRGRQHRVSPGRVFLQGNRWQNLYVALPGEKGWNLAEKNNFTQTLCTLSFLYTGEELLPELQRVLYSDHAAVHEAGLRQDAHRLQ